jgi:hypothetical protein
LIFNAIFIPTLRVLDPIYFYKLYQRKKLKEKLTTIHQEDIDVSQREANDIFEGPKLQIDYNYSDLGKTSLLTFFFIPIFPSAVIISTVGLVYCYWVDKVNILLILDTVNI